MGKEQRDGSRGSRGMCEASRSTILNKPGLLADLIGEALKPDVVFVSVHLRLWLLCERLCGQSGRCTHCHSGMAPAPTVSA